ncbi:hypothetical protein EJ02DRAFT_129700 [Clathrospora elynae]|uniref:LisH domain-containing protein n=1 Tax=Clathrospora elynae TaxID=706981 RepID=A0A6A5SW51_9PLEO|nr:hypothetical protein EJ02DRAFT_129700 [Clathrospora elynae]
MQSQQMAQMAAMNAHNGPVDGTPTMGNMAHPERAQMDPREQLNTYIYDYFLRNKHGRLARAMLDGEIKLSTQKPSPKNRANGADAMDDDAIDDLPAPQMPDNQVAENSFLLDWWVQFWDIFQANGRRPTATKSAAQYINHTRTLGHMQNEQRNQRMMMTTNSMNATYQNAMRSGAMVNGAAPKDLMRAAAMNNNRPNGNPMPGMPQMKNPNMIAAHMQRDGSGMNMNGQRPQSPASNENAPSPNKRPRVDGGMNAGSMPGSQFSEFAQQGAQLAQQKNMQEVYAQSLAQQHRVALNNTSSPQAMDSGIQGSTMAQPGLEGQEQLFTGNGPRPGANAPGASNQGNHALQDYQMQLMLLEQQNKKRLLMARQEQDNMPGPHQQGAVGAPGFGAMSPQGSRPGGPSPNPTDQMKRGTPKLGQQALPGSPMPEGVMQQQRGSPAPNLNSFDPALAPPGMPPQFYTQMPHNPIMRPPSSHPGPNFNGQPLTPQQMDAMRNSHMQNGGWRGPPQPGMMPGGPQMAGPMGQNPPQRNMAPPPAPTNEQPRPEPSPSQSNQAPPTPSQGNKAGPKKKPTKDNKKPANKKGSNASAITAATNGEEPPTPTSSTPVAPITPVHKQSFQGPNGQQQQPVQPQPPSQQQPMDNGGPPFGNIEDPNGFDLNLGFGDETGALENFDFETFLHTNDNDGFGNLGDFDFPNTAEVVGDM